MDEEIRDLAKQHGVDLTPDQAVEVKKAVVAGYIDMVLDARKPEVPEERR